MRRHSSTYAIRYALWRAYGMKCFYCGQPLDFMSMHVDHILPRSLGANPEVLRSTLDNYGIADSYPGFSIDALTNLAPCHGASCNLRKGDGLLPKQASLFYLSITHQRLPAVIAELERLNALAEKGDALATLGILMEKGQVSNVDVSQFLRDWEFRTTLDEPLVVTFGLDFANTIEMRGFDFPEASVYAIACDRFETELVEAIRQVTDHSFHYTEASARDGETLSVRLAFPELSLADADALPLGLVTASMPWWEVLELTNFFEAYGERYSEALDC